MLNVYFFEQPSIQKLVSNCASECLAHLSEEAVHSEAYREDTPGVLAALDDLEGVFSDSLVDKVLLNEALEKMEARFTEETRKHERNVRHPVAYNPCILTHTIAAGICPCRCLKAKHTRSSPIASVARLAAHIGTVEISTVLHPDSLQLATAKYGSDARTRTLLPRTVCKPPYRNQGHCRSVSLIANLFVVQA